MDEDTTQPAAEDERPEPAPNSEGHSTARRPGDKLDQDRESTETVPRKSSLL